MEQSEQRNEMLSLLEGGKIPNESTLAHIRTYATGDFLSVLCDRLWRLNSFNGHYCQSF